MKMVVTEGTPWAVVPIESLFEIVGGGTPDTKVAAYWNGSIPFATSADISDDGVSARRTVSESGIENSTARIVPSGSVLVATRVGLGKVAVTTNRIAFSQDIQALVPKFDANTTVSRFVTDELRGIVAGFRQVSRGTTISGVTKNQVRELLLAIPPLEEQKKIVSTIDSLLSRITAAEKELDRAQQLLTRLRQSLLTRAFDGSLTASWRRANETESADDLLARISEEREAHHRAQLADWEARVTAWEQNGKEGKRPTKPRKPKEVEPLTAEELAELPRLPERWRWVKLGEAAILERGKSKHRPRNDARLFGGEFPFVQTGEVSAADRVITDFVETYNEMGLAQSRRWPEGTLCITIAANIAETAILGFDACFPDSVVGLSNPIDETFRDYVFWFFQQNQRAIEAMAPATAQKNINLNILWELRFPLPPTSEQNQIVSLLSRHTSVIRRRQEEITTSRTRLKALRRSILQAAFSGRLTAKWRAEHPELISGENSAEALLARIKEESTT